jgi:hypothetical protein
VAQERPQLIDFVEHLLHNATNRVGGKLLDAKALGVEPPREPGMGGRIGFRHQTNDPRGAGAVRIIAVSGQVLEMSQPRDGDAVGFGRAVSVGGGDFVRSHPINTATAINSEALRLTRAIAKKHTALMLQ